MRLSCRLCSKVHMVMCAFSLVSAKRFDSGSRPCLHLTHAHYNPSPCATADTTL
jgi:hypothetical protein